MERCFICNQVKLNRFLEDKETNEGIIRVCKNQEQCEKDYLELVISSFEMQISFLKESLGLSTEEVLHESVKAYCTALINKIKDNDLEGEDEYED